MNVQCRKCGEVSFVVVCQTFAIEVGWFFRLAWPFLHFGPHQVPNGFLARCTRHGCGREWVITATGLAEPGVTTPARVVAIPPVERPRVEPEREDADSMDGLRGAVRRASV